MLQHHLPPVAELSQMVASVAFRPLGARIDNQPQINYITSMPYLLFPRLILIVSVQYPLYFYQIVTNLVPSGIHLA